MDDATLIRRFAGSFQDIDIPEPQARSIAGILRSVNDLARAGAGAIPFEAEAAGFLQALEADEEADGGD